MTVMVQKRTVRGCPVHRALMDEALKRLEAHDAFRFADLLDACNYQAMSESIRWDYLREFVEEDSGQELVPINDAYFRRHSFKEELANPGKFVAGAGGNRVAAGYVWFADRTKHLVAHYLTARHHQIGGAQQSYTIARAKVIERFGADVAPPALELFPVLVPLRKPAA